MIQVSTMWDYGDDYVINKELERLQKSRYKIIDIKFSTHAVIRENQREGGQDILETQAALIIYDDLK